MKKTLMMAAAIIAMSMAVVMTSCKKESKNEATDSNSGTCTCTYHDFETGERYTEKVSMKEAGVTRCDAMDAYVAGSFELSCK